MREGDEARWLTPRFGFKMWGWFVREIDAETCEVRHMDGRLVRVPRRNVVAGWYGTDWPDHVPSRAA